MTENCPNLMYYPLVLVIEDCFVPQSAQLVVTAVREMDTEVVGAQLQLEAAIAELSLERN